MKSKIKMTKTLVLVPFAMVLIFSLERGEAKAPSSLPDFDYSFETLVNNQSLFGQDQWVNGVVGSVAVRTGPGVNQTQTAKGEGGNAGSGAIRPLDYDFYYTTNDTAVVWGAWGYVPSGGNNVTAIGGIIPCVFGPHQVGGLTQLTTFLQRQSSPTQLYGDVLLHDHWYEYRVIVNFSITGASATLSYRDVTAGATVFTNDTLLQNVNLGLVPDASGRYGFFDVFIRNDGAAYVDNLHFEAPGATGDPLLVNSTTDTVDAVPGDGACLTAGGVCTLRAAIMETNALFGADTIGFDPNLFSVARTITLDQRLPTILQDLIITGPSARLTVNANGAARVFSISGVSTATISDLTLTGGVGFNGGAISNEGTLTLTRVTVRGNRTVGNGFGGGIYNTGPTLILNSSTVSGNTAFGDGQGGGIWTGGRPATVILNNSTVSGNSAGIGIGGGIMNTQDTVILNNSTVSGNSSRLGGGIANDYSAVAIELNNSTITGNIADNGSALRLNVGRVFAKNSILDGLCSLAGGAVTSLGYNLDSGGGCQLDQPSDRHSPPNLGLLQNNGGATETHALLPGSPAIDAVPLEFCTLSTDQRGVNRPQGATCDIGAYEVGTACAQLPSGLIGWWPGDNHSNDLADGNNGTLLGGVGYATGTVGQAFSFPSLGSTGLDRVALNTGPSANTFTIEAWVFANQHGPSAYRTIYANDDRGFWLKSGSLNWWSPGIGDRFVGNTALPLGSWHHIALTYAQGTFTGYVNGVDVGSSFAPGEFLPTGSGLGIGGHNYLPEDFDGLIDELAIYDRALNAAEIQAIFNAGSEGKCKTIENPNQPPVANAGPAQTLEATSPSGAAVTLNGSGSSDPDSDPLTYNWAGTFGTASGVNPTVNLPLGTHTVTLTVDDGQATATDTASITVRDTTAPDTIINSAVDGNGAAVSSSASTLSHSITFNFGGTDIVGVSGFQCSLDGGAFSPCSSPLVQTTLAIGSHLFQVRARDAAGNIDPSPANFSWAVVTPAQAVLNLINTIANMGLPAGVANSLSAPLGQASKLLNDNNPNNDVAACGKLNALTNQIDAKVQNGQLSPAQASQLMQEANAIKGSLGC